MKTRLFISLFALLTLAAFAFAQENVAAKAEPRLKLEAGSHDFGTVAEGSEVRHTFKVRNEGTAELLIKNVSPGCG